MKDCDIHFFLKCFSGQVLSDSNPACGAVSGGQRVLRHPETKLLKRKTKQVLVLYLDTQCNFPLVVFITFKVSIENTYATVGKSSFKKYPT